MNRPLLWNEAIDIDWSEDQATNGNLDNISAMQEALTCEWLIEQGLMPDPTEFRPMFTQRLYDLTSDNTKHKAADWICEDKTK